MRHRLYRSGIFLSLCVCAATTPVGAQAPASSPLCQQIADHIRTDLMPVPVRQTQPLRALAALPDGFLRLVTVENGSATSGSSVAEDLQNNHGASVDFVEKVTEMESSNLDVIRFPNSDVWLLDSVQGTAYCHMVLAVAMPPSGAATEISLPFLFDPTATCGATLDGGIVDGTAALIFEQDGEFVAGFTTSSISVAALHGRQFALPCEVKVHYSLIFQTQDAFCNGVDCALVKQKADALTARRDAGESADALGAGAISPEASEAFAEYQRMAELARATQTAELPTFNSSITPYMTTFRDDIVFPISLGDRRAYLARLGHASRGWRDSSDYLMAIYKLESDQLVPVAGLSVRVARSRITAVQAR